MEGLLIVAVLVVLGLAVIGRYSRDREKKSAPPTHPDWPGVPLDKWSEARSEPRPISESTPFDETRACKPAAAVAFHGSVYVVDGDTIVIQKTQIRLFGVDAPELDHPYGKKAKWALVALCKGQSVRAEVLEFDGHGRTVAKCYLEDGRDLSAEMVKQGLAIDWPKFSDGKYRTLEVPGVRKKLWLADARQKGRMHVWEQFEARRNGRNTE